MASDVIVELTDGNFDQEVAYKQYKAPILP